MAITGNKIMIVGCGPGSPDFVTPAARAAVECADVLIGAQRLLDLFSEGGSGEAERIVVKKDTEAVLREITARHDHSRVVVLVTGDPGLFSLASAIIVRFGRDACGIVPGVSAVQMAFARFGLGSQDACVISAHASEPELCFGEFRTYRKIAVLGGGKELGPRVSPLLNILGRERYRFFACEDLTLPEERIFEIDTDGLAGHAFSSRTVILIVRKDLL
jgi:precorrin-6y C5,15-methyltransferase (decarboxylating) CbiE subunit